jgi:multisite-specific tRNA:(cytosine-C5)-methyltransferase
VLPGLISAKGVKNWKVIGKDYEEKKRGEDPNYGDELFPPTEDEDYNLEDCIRVYPHLQNTGGFFITVLEKVNQDTDDEQPLKKVKRDYTSEYPKKEKLSTTANDDTSEPFNFLSPDNEEVVNCWNFYGFDKNDKDFINSLFVRNATGEAARNIYLSSPTVRDYLVANEEKLKIIHSGVRLFVSQRTDLECKWRIQNDAISAVSSKLTEARVLDCNKEMLEKLLKEGFPRFEELAVVDKEFAENVQKLSQGCAFVRVRENGAEELLYSIWVGTKCINLMLSKKETFEVLYRIFDVETSNQGEYKQTPTGPGKAIGQVEHSTTAEES